jgi:hypothetical protein
MLPLLQLGERRVRLLAQHHGHSAVTLEVLGPEGTWEDSSLVADRDLERHTASLCYPLRRVEQETRVIQWNTN